MGERIGLSRFAAATLGLALTAGSGACAPEELECGPDTYESNGYCSVIPEPNPTCGEGTDFDADSGECVARIVCGEGTELDADSGECVSLFACGTGTVIDLATGECVAVVQCGPGTLLQDGECVTEAACGPGTVLEVASQSCLPVEPCVGDTFYNPETGRCESDLICGAGQVVVGGLCLPEGREIVGLATAFESSNDANDPAVGGSPEILPALLPEGEVLVFLGRIGRPADIDGNGTVDQDLDVWQFEGSAGQYLRIRVLNTGLPQPVFMLDGPGGYHRESAIGFTVEAQRELLLPRSGSYRLTVAPSVYITAGLAIGGTEAGYAGAIEVLPIPVPPSVAPAAAGETAARVTGNLTFLGDNFVKLLAPARTAVVVEFTELGEDAAPAVVAFSTDDRLVTDVVIDRAQGTWAATFVGQQDGTWLVIDWVSARGPQDDFTAELRKVDLVESGILVAGTSIATPAQDIAAGQAAAFAYEITGNQILQLTVAAQGPIPEPDLQLLGPDGTRSVVWDDDSLFAFAEAGEFVAFVRNDEPEVDQIGVFLAGALPPTVDLGTLSPEGPETEITVSGARLTHAYGGPESYWAIIDTPPATMLEVVVEVEAGNAELAVYERSGEELRRVRQPQLDRRLHVLNPGGEPVVIDLHPFRDFTGKSGVVEAWSMHLHAVPQPVSIDGEPNDTLLTPTDVGEAPFVGIGTLTETTAAFDFRDKDIFRVSLAEPLGPGQVLGIWFDNLDGDPTIFDLGAVSVRLYDANRVPLPSIPGQLGQVSGVVEASSFTYLATDDPGPFLIELTEWKVEETARYILRGEVIDLVAESEPNDALADAVELGGIPARAVGYWDSVNDNADLYRFELAGALPADTSVVVALSNLETGDNFTLSLLDDAGGLIAAATGPRTSLQVPSLDAGSYYVRAVGSASQSPPYDVRVELGGRMEVEPNDTAADAIFLGELSLETPLTIDGTATAASVDVFTFDFGAGSPAGENVLVEAVNLSDNSNVRVDFYYGDDPATDTVVSSDAGSVARAVSKVATTGGPYAVKVTGSNDRYRLAVQVGPPAESEPNDDSASGDPIGVPGRIYGVVNASDTDVYRVTLNDDLGSHEILEVTLYNVVDTTPVKLDLLAEDFSTELASDTGPTAKVGGEALVADTYYVRITQPSGSSFETDYYQLDLRVVDPSQGGTP